MVNLQTVSPSSRTTLIYQIKIATVVVKLYQQAQPLDWTLPLEQLTADLAKLNTTAHSVERNHSNA